MTQREAETAGEARVQGSMGVEEEGFRKPWCLALEMETGMGSCVSGDTCKLTWSAECVNGLDHSVGNTVIANH